MVYYTDFRVPQLGRTFFIAKSRQGVCRISFDNNETRFIEDLKISSDGQLVKSRSSLKDEVAQILEYYAGKRKNFSLKAVLNGTKFQNAVWLALAKVEFGDTVSYTQLAELAGNKKAVRAAATCCAVNPVPVIIPCHRIISKSGAIGGFGGGIPMKKFMLKLEGAL